VSTRPKYKTSNTVKCWHRVKVVCRYRAERSSNIRKTKLLDYSMRGRTGWKTGKEEEIATTRVLNQCSMKSDPQYQPRSSASSPTMQFVFTHNGEMWSHQHQKRLDGGRDEILARRMMTWRMFWFWWVVLINPLVLSRRFTMSPGNSWTRREKLRRTDYNHQSALTLVIHFHALAYEKQSKRS